MQQTLLMKTERAKKKVRKKRDGSWDTRDLYKTSRNPFEIEWLKYFNPMEGRNQIIFLNTDKETKKIVKHRILR